MPQANNSRAAFCRVIAELMVGRRTAQQLAQAVDAPISAVYRWTADLQKAGVIVIADTIPQPNVRLYGITC